MAWQPGQRVLTEADRAEWQAWRREQKREAQRWRRARYPRIDYYPDAAAHERICSLVGTYVGGDFSSVINRIVSEWDDHCHRNKQKPEKGKCTVTPATRTPAVE